MNELDDCECGHDIAAHVPTVRCSLCDCSAYISPELRRHVAAIAAMPRPWRRAVAQVITGNEQWS